MIALGDVGTFLWGSMSKNKSIIKSLFVFLLVAFICPIAGNATEMPKASKQAGVFRKVFKFSKALRGKKAKVLAAYNADTKFEIKMVVKAFSKRGIPTKAVKMEDLADKIGGVAIVYTLADAEAVGKLCEENGKLSITGDASLVEGGNISVGVADVSGKIVIKVHLAKSKAEGHVFAPTFLKMAKVIR